MVTDVVDEARCKEVLSCCSSLSQRNGCTRVSHKQWPVLKGHLLLKDWECSVTAHTYTINLQCVHEWTMNPPEAWHDLYPYLAILGAKP